MARIFYGCPSPDAQPPSIWDVIDPNTYESREGWTELTTQADTEPTPIDPTVEAAVVNALQQECGQTSEEHGFKDDWFAADWLEALASYLDKEDRFTTDKTVLMGWDRADALKDSDIPHVSTVEGLRQVAVILRTNILGTKLALIHSELSEALESLRKNGGAAGALDGEGNFGEELADAIVRILDTGTFTKDPLGDQLLHKMAVNRDRPHMHGNKAM